MSLGNVSGGGGGNAFAFEMTRDFDAPLSRVWPAWSHPQALGRWWGPTGCEIEVLRLEFRPGGVFHYAMAFPGDFKMYGRFVYREIVDGQRIVWLNGFANEHGGIARAPFSEVCPMEIENSVSFTEQEGVTTMKLRAQPFGATPPEAEFFEGLGDSLVEGYGGTFDKLASYLGK